MTTDEPTMLDFDVEVVAVTRPSPTFVRVTFAGESLRLLAPGGPEGNLDRRVKLLIPSPGHPLPQLNLAERPAGDVGWYKAWLAMDPAVRGSMRTYTIRSSRGLGRDQHARPPIGGDGTRAAEAPQIDIDFVLHADDGGESGPAAAWAATAQSGDRITLIGPNSRNDTGVGIAWHPGAARRVLLAGDETALPAISAILESLPEQVAGDALIEVPTADDRMPVTTASAVRTTWMPREGRPHGHLLQEAVRRTCAGQTPAHADSGTVLEEVDVDSVVLWEEPAAASGDFYAWIAGEAATVRDLRRHLVRDLGVDRRQVAFMGYWRAGRPEPT